MDKFMKSRYDFDRLYNRRGSNCVKWDSSADENMLPMWVADMDFPAAPAIIDAVKRRAAEGIYGYVRIPDCYYDSVRRWFANRHGWRIENNSDIIYIPGIVPALCTLVNALVPEHKGVIFQSPAYNCFFSSVEENNRRMAVNPLLRVDKEDGFTFRIDFEGLEKLAADPDNELLIFCNPHNPTGRVWSRGELIRVSDICRRHGVTVVSDEIHCEIVHPGFDYVPFATIDPDCVTCCSPTKGFNIAGLMVSNIVTRRADLREKIKKEIKANEANNANPFGIVALQAAYDDGADWLDALNGYLNDNFLYLRKELNRRMPALKICNSEATYLAWVDVMGLGISADEVEAKAKADGHVWVNSGRMYGDGQYIRINYACPRPLLAEGIDRFCRVFGC